MVTCFELDIALNHALKSFVTTSKDNAKWKEFWLNNSDKIIDSRHFFLWSQEEQIKWYKDTLNIYVNGVSLTRIACTLTKGSKWIPQTE
jgi:hypothetical protein